MSNLNNLYGIKKAEETTYAHLVEKMYLPFFGWTLIYIQTTRGGCAPPHNKQKERI